MQYKRIAKGCYEATASNGATVTIKDVYDPSGARVNRSAKRDTKHWLLTIDGKDICRYYRLSDAKGDVRYYL